MRRQTPALINALRVVTVCLAMLAAALALAGCVAVGGSGPSGGWDRAPRNIADDWRELDMQNLMAYSDTWFTADGQQRGTLKGFPSGGVSVESDGGYCELSVIFRQYGVPVQQTVRVYFDRFTAVYSNGSRAGTVLGGLTTGGGVDVTRAGHMLQVPFYVNGGRLFAERVNVLEEPSPLQP